MLSQSSVFPATLTYLIIGIIFLAFVFRRLINLDKILITLSSFLFIFSGFIVQIVATNHDKLEHFFEEWGKALSSPPITVLATASGIFIGNTLLKFFSAENSRRETSIVFINGLEAHIRSLSTLDFYFSSDNIDAATFQIYFTKIRDNKSYEKALIEIGRFRDNETNILSKYESHLWTTLIDVERSLNNSNIPILYSRLKITATIIYAMLCSCTLAKKHWPTQANQQEESFLRDFPRITEWLLDQPPIDCPVFIRRGFVEILMDVRKKYQGLNKNSIAEQIHSLKILYLPLSNSSNFGDTRELMIFGSAIDEMEVRARNYLSDNYSMSPLKIDQMMINSQSEMLSPWN